MALKLLIHVDTCMLTDFLDVHNLTVNISQYEKFLCSFFSVDSDEDDEEEESHSSREVCRLVYS